MRRAAKILILGLLAAVLLAGLLVGALNYAGFCFEKGGFLSDEEKIQLTVANVISRRSSFIEEQKAKNYSTYQADLEAKVDEFLKGNPTCCRIGPEGGDGYPEPTLWRRVRGIMSAIVVVEGIPNVFNRPIQQFAITNCGKVW